MATIQQSATHNAEKQTTISSHVLDTQNGKPASGLRLKLHIKDAQGKWQLLASGVTSADGRVTSKDFGVTLPGVGRYRMTFYTAEYFDQKQIQHFLYPKVPIVFELKQSDLAQHYHIPLILSPYGFSTYRGS
jgi:5-hydroxyisourate hydrolase